MDFGPLIVVVGSGGFGGLSTLAVFHTHVALSLLIVPVRLDTHVSSLKCSVALVGQRLYICERISRWSSRCFDNFVCPRDTSVY